MAHEHDIAVPPQAMAYEGEPISVLRLPSDKERALFVRFTDGKLTTDQFLAKIKRLSETEGTGLSVDNYAVLVSEFAKSKQD